MSDAFHLSGILTTLSVIICFLHSLNLDCSFTEPGLVSSPELVGGATRFLFLTYFMLLEASPFSAEGSRVGAKQRGNLKASFEARWALKVCRADEVTLPGTSNEGLR